MFRKIKEGVGMCVDFVLQFLSVKWSPGGLRKIPVKMYGDRVFLGERMTGHV